jgi:hypothetical protein
VRARRRRSAGVHADRWVIRLTRGRCPVAAGMLVPGILLTSTDKQGRRGASDHRRGA